MMPKVFVSTVPFGAINERPLELLRAAGIQCVINPLGRKLKELELKEIIGSYDALIAGTENISREVLHEASQLKLISRVGVGLDSVDLVAARNFGVLVSYTPEAPVLAVADLTLGLMFSLLRHIHEANILLHQGVWNRFFGRRLAEVTVGIIGVGRIGATVINHLLSLGVKKILANDVVKISQYDNNPSITWVSKKEIYENSDIISIHVPLNLSTKNMIAHDEFNFMKKDALLVNTARGGIVNESDLILALERKKIGGAAIDVFELEPYSGKLLGNKSCLLTSHMGSMSIDCRARMEIEATEEIIRFFNGEALMGLVPESEYQNQGGAI